MINVAVIDGNGKSRMFLRNTLTYLGNEVKSYADIFYFSNHIITQKKHYDALVYNISDSFTRDSFKSLKLLLDVFTIPIIIVSKKRNVQLFKALQKMGVERHVINDDDLGDSLTMALSAIEKVKEKTKIQRKNRILRSLSSYFVIVGLVVLAMLTLGGSDPETMGVEEPLYFRGNTVPVLVGHEDTICSTDLKIMINE